MNRTYLKTFRDYILILLGSILYAASTVLFIFPHRVLLGGTSGISVILEAFLPFSPGTILTVINFLLIVAAFILLGRDMAVRTLVGSALTTLAVGLLEKPLTFPQPLLANPYLSALAGACVIAVASGVMFYVRSSSGGTDVIALIVQKFSRISIGKALLITDILIVIVGGLLSGLTVFAASAIGLLVKTFGIDFVIGRIKKFQPKNSIYCAGKWDLY